LLRRRPKSLAMPTNLDRCLAVVPLADGRSLYVFRHLAAVPPEWRELARPDASGRAWWVVA
jgi:hypothetical protein